MEFERGLFARPSNSDSPIRWARAMQGFDAGCAYEVTLSESEGGGTIQVICVAAGAQAQNPGALWLMEAQVIKGGVRKL